MRLLPLIGCLCLLTACGRLLMPSVEDELGELPQGNYELDPNHTTVLFKVEHLGISTFVGRFNEVEASLSFDPDNPQNSRLEARVDMASLDVDQPDFEDTLRGCNWLCVERYPQARLVTRGPARIDGDQWHYDAELSFRGVTNPVEIDVIFKGGADNILTGRYTLGFEARLSFLRSDFGMGSFVPAVGDRVRLEAHTEFKKQRQ